MKTSRPTPTIIALAVVLMLAMGGVGYAAGALPKNSVGTKQLKSNAVTSSKIKGNAVAGADVAANSLTGADINEGTLSIPDKAGSLILSGYDFRARGSVTTLGNDYYGGVFITGESDYLAADLDVPIGATITTIDVYVTDNGSDEIVATLTRYTPSTGDSVDFGSVATVGASGVIQTLSMTQNKPVDNVSDLRLLAKLPVGEDYVIHGAKVNYVYDAELGG